MAFQIAGLESHATYTMTLPQRKLSTSWTQEEDKRSFRRLYTRILPSRFCSRKRDLSLNQILCQFRNVQHLNLLYQRTLSRLRNGVNTALPRLDPATRNIAICHLQAGESQKEVAWTLNVNQSIMSRLWNRFQQTGSMNDYQRSRKPRITTLGQDRYIRVFHLRIKPSPHQPLR
jgi:hypothetical protein